MLSSLDALAGKISPGSGKNSPKQHLDNNANKISHLNHNVHPYQKPIQVQDQNNICKETALIMNNLNGNNNNNGISNNNNNNNINNNNNNMCSSPEPSISGEQPDPDYIKMFVGQVPKSMDENQLKEMFEVYGRVHSINVLRDKVTGISKGCCFVTFFTRKAALLAQDALHNIKTLDGMHHPIQMKPADSENRNERKLFIGMLNKKLSENEVRKLFEGHGTIEECTVLRDQNGQSKGCAFVTFSSKQAAIGAIKGLYSIQLLHQTQTMEGCSAPLVVKFADTQKEKEHKKMQQMHANLWNLTAANINIPLAQSAATVAAPMMHNPPQQPSPILATDAISPASIQLLQQLQAVGLHQQLLQGIASQPEQQSGLLPSMTVQNLAALAAMTQPSMQPAAQQPSAQLTNAAALLWSDPTGLSNPYLQQASLPQFGGSGLTTSPLTNNTLTSAAAVAAGKHIEGISKRNVTWRKQDFGQMILISGPEGCNLFIYHLPQEFTDTDLASTFLPFGNVISAKVFIDKQTNLSKCFGFVSFDNPDSAQAAIKAMHGFPIGTKRLKVQLKKPKDSSKPY